MKNVACDRGLSIRGKHGWAAQIDPDFAPVPSLAHYSNSRTENGLHN